MLVVARQDLLRGQRTARKVSSFQAPPMVTFSRISPAALQTVPRFFLRFSFEKRKKFSSAFGKHVCRLISPRHSRSRREMSLQVQISDSAQTPFESIYLPCSRSSVNDAWKRDNYRTDSTDPRSLKMSENQPISTL